MVLEIAYLGLGSNLGDRLAHLTSALAALDRIPHARVFRRSSIYETEPQVLLAQPRFLNLIAGVETSLEPHKLLEALHDIERSEGRDRSASAIRWGPRTLDLDILLFGTRVVQTERLTIPHPRMSTRRFVLEPLVEIAPDLAHPATGERWASLLPAVQDQALKRLADAELL